MAQKLPPEIPIVYKAPDEERKIWLDWAGYLFGETIESCTFPETSSLVNEEDFFDDSETWVMVSGGTIGSKCLVTTRVVTSGGETLEQSVEVRIVRT